MDCNDSYLVVSEPEIEEEVPVGLLSAEPVENPTLDGADANPETETLPGDPALGVADVDLAEDEVDVAEVDVDAVEPVDVDTVLAGLELFVANLDGGCSTQLVSACRTVNGLLCLRYWALTAFLDDETAGLCKSTAAIIYLELNRRA